MSELVAPPSGPVPCANWTRDGNAFSLVGAIRRCLQNAKRSKEEISLFSESAMAGDYDHLVATCMLWVANEEDEEDEYCEDCWALIDQCVCGDDNRDEYRG